jgi:hypothetical protein
MLLLLLSETEAEAAAEAAGNGRKIAAGVASIPKMNLDLTGWDRGRNLQKLNALM